MVTNVLILGDLSANTESIPRSRFACASYGNGTCTTHLGETQHKMASIVYSIATAATATNISKWTIIDAIRDGHIEATIDGNHVRVDGDSLRAWVSGLDERPRTTLVEVPGLGGGVGLTDDLGELKPESLADLV